MARLSAEAREPSIPATRKSAQNRLHQTKAGSSVEQAASISVPAPPQA